MHSIWLSTLGAKGGGEGFHVTRYVAVSVSFAPEANVPNITGIHPTRHRNEPSMIAVGMKTLVEIFDRSGVSHTSGTSLVEVVNSPISMSSAS